MSELQLTVSLPSPSVCSFTDGTAGVLTPKRGCAQPSDAQMIDHPVSIPSLWSAWTVPPSALESTGHTSLTGQYIQVLITSALKAVVCASKR